MLRSRSRRRSLTTLPTRQVTTSPWSIRRPRPARRASDPSQNAPPTPHPPLLSPTGEGGSGGEGTLKPPAGRAVRLGGGDTEDRVEGEAVEVPGRRSRARRAVRRRERLALHLRRPPALAVQAGHRLQRRPIGHPGRFALQDEVDALQAHGDRAGRVRRQIARLAGARPAGEIDVAVVPERADAGGVRPAVRARRAEETTSGIGGVGEAIARPAPRQLSGSVAVEIGDFDWLLARSSCTSSSVLTSLMRRQLLRGALLHHPAVAVGIAEKDERVPVSASSIDPDTTLEVLDRADLHTPLEQLRPRGVDVGDDQLDPLHRPRGRRGETGPDGDRAGRAGRRQLHDPHVVADAGVVVDDEADLLAVEALGPVHVRHRDHHQLELPIHQPSSFHAAEQSLHSIVVRECRSSTVVPRPCSRLPRQAVALVVCTRSIDRQLSASQLKRYPRPCRLAVLPSCRLPSDSQ